MTADILEHPDGALMSAHREQGSSEEVDRHRIACGRNILAETDPRPLIQEHTLALELSRARIDVKRARQAPGLIGRSKNRVE
jgi:hypothetical protein